MTYLSCMCSICRNAGRVVYGPRLSPPLELNHREEAVGEFSLDVPLPFAIKLRSCSAEMVQSFPTSGNASKVEVRSKFVD